MNITKALTILAITCLAITTGCNKNKTEELDNTIVLQKIDAQITLANEHLDKGEPKTALSILEKLEHSHPEQSSILEALAFAHATQQDHELAAFYFDQVYRLDPAHAEACLFAADAYAQIEEWDQAIHNYEIYVQTYPKDPAVWKTMSGIYATLNRPHAALKAFQTYTRTKETPVSGEEALTLAKLSNQLGNTQQAESWYTAALQDDSIQEEALLGLLQINLSAQDWPAVQNIILMLDEVNPDALDSSSLSGVRSELERWRNAVAAEEAEDQNQTTLVSQSQESHTPHQWIQQRQENKEQFAKKWKRKQAFKPATTQQLPEKIESPEPQEIAQLANDPALNKVDPIDKTLKLVFNSIVSHSNGTKLATDAVATADNPFIPDSIRGLPSPKPSITANDIKPLPAKIIPVEVKEPEPIDFFAEGQKLKTQGKYDDAIQEYWQAVALDDTPSHFWNELSETYMLNTQFEEAEMTALEALRRDPSNIQYALTYLRAAHKTKPTDVFLTELTKAEQRFPKSPEITLALARTYDGDPVQYNPRKAIGYYSKFIREFPHHPKKAEAEVALQRLR